MSVNLSINFFDADTGDEIEGLGDVPAAAALRAGDVVSSIIQDPIRGLGQPLSILQGPHLVVRVAHEFRRRGAGAHDHYLVVFVRPMKNEQA